jgi:CDP-diacylglycerol--glycerol-3-phosphate 3-phosphatidyltransferase
MNTSMNDPQDSLSASEVSGALADALTLVRIALTPLIMFVIIKAWGENLNLQLVLLASILFVIAALTDILDDTIGGTATTKKRLLGWMDDISDSVLIAGTLAALMWALNNSGLLHWTFATPALVIIARDMVIGLIKGRSLRQHGFLETKLGDIKGALTMLATCLLVASPWLTNIVERVRAGNDVENISKIYSNAIPWVWNGGLIILWIAAILALITGFALLTNKPTSTNDNIDKSRTS